MSLPKNNKLSISILEARNLPGVDFIGKLDPYIMIEENSFLGTPYHTAVVKSNLNPKWKDEKFECLFEEDYCADLRFRLYDKKLLSKDQYIGDVIVPFKRMLNEKHIDEWFPISGQGELHLVITLEFQAPIYNPGSEIDLTGVAELSMVRNKYAPAEWKHVWAPIVATIDANKEFNGCINESQTSLHNAVTYENFPAQIIYKLEELKKTNVKALLIFAQRSMGNLDMKTFQFALALQNKENGALIGTVRWLTLKDFDKDANKRGLMGYIVMDEKPRFVVLPEIVHCKSTAIEDQVKEVAGLIKL